MLYSTEPRRTLCSLLYLSMAEVSAFMTTSVSCERARRRVRPPQQVSQFGRYFPRHPPRLPASAARELLLRTCWGRRTEKEGTHHGFLTVPSATAARMEDVMKSPISWLCRESDAYSENIARPSGDTSGVSLYLHRERQSACVGLGGWGAKGGSKEDLARTFP